MVLKPRHLAAVQYSLLAAFLVASWYVLLSPPERAFGQLEFVFAQGYEKRMFFIFFALSTVAALLLAVLYWLPSSTSSPISKILPFAAIAIFALAVWQFDTTLIFGFGLGCSFALWAWYAPNTALNNGRADKRRVS